MQESNQQSKRFRNECGALWIKTSQQGTKFMAGRITINEQPVEIVVFKNTKKEEGSKQPDFRIYESQPLPSTMGTGPAQVPVSATDRPTPDDVPFN